MAHVTNLSYILDKKGEQVSHKPVILKDKIYTHQKGSKLEGLIDSVHVFTSKNEIPLPASTSYFAEAKSLSEEGNRLSALLALFEYVLTTGEQPTTQIKELMKYQETDTMLRKFIISLAPPQSEEDAYQKLDQFGELLNEDIAYGYIMNIFAANTIQQADLIEAILLFNKALENNPFITGAWHDLGKLHANRYDFLNAWKCFEIMFRLNEKHSLAKEIHETKARLIDEQLDFFTLQT